MTLNARLVQAQVGLGLLTAMEWGCRHRPMMERSSDHHRRLPMHPPNGASPACCSSTPDTRTSIMIGEIAIKIM